MKQKLKNIKQRIKVIEDTVRSFNTQLISVRRKFPIQYPILTLIGKSRNKGILNAEAGVIHDENERK